MPVMKSNSKHILFTEQSWGIIVQARMGSKRIPGKMLRVVNGKQVLLDWVLERLLQVFPEERVILATTTSAHDTPLAVLAEFRNISVFRGSETDVLNRFREAARNAGWDYIVRVCADNPMLQVLTINELVAVASIAKADYASYFFSDGLPSIRSHCGLFAEWASLDALDRVASLSDDPFDHEHVTNYLYTHPASFQNIALPVPYEEYIRHWRLTIDTQADLDLCTRIIDSIGKDGSRKLKVLLEHINTHSELLSEMKINMSKNAK